MMVVNNMNYKNFIACICLLSPGVALAQSPFIGTAEKDGIKTCQPLLKLVSDYIIGDTAHSSISRFHQGQPDGWLYSTFNTIARDAGDAHVSIVAAPTAGGKCSATYVYTYSEAKTCDEVRKGFHARWKFSDAMLNDSISLIDEEGAAMAFLSSQKGDTCLVSFQEVLYEDS